MGMASRIACCNSRISIFFLGKNELLSPKHQKDCTIVFSVMVSPIEMGQKGRTWVCYIRTYVIGRPSVSFWVVKGTFRCLSTRHIHLVNEVESVTSNFLRIIIMFLLGKRSNSVVGVIFCEEKEHNASRKISYPWVIHLTFTDMKQ